MFVIYPLITLSAALTISQNKFFNHPIFVFWKSGSFGRVVKLILIFAFTLLSVSRTFGQVEFSIFCIYFFFVCCFLFFVVSHLCIYYIVGILPCTTTNLVRNG